MNKYIHMSRSGLATAFPFCRQRFIFSNIAVLKIKYPVINN